MNQVYIHWIKHLSILDDQLRFYRQQEEDGESIVRVLDYYCFHARSLDGDTFATLSLITTLDEIVFRRIRIFDLVKISTRCMTQTDEPSRGAVPRRQNDFAMYFRINNNDNYLTTTAQYILLD